MFYQNKQTKELVELIYSDNTFCIYVSAKEIEDVSSELNGNMLQGNKGNFKKYFKKVKKCDIQPLEKEAIDSIVSTYLFDKKRLSTEKGMDDLVVLTQTLHEGKENEG
jgi:tRNA G10  N-methylase Trm11